MLYLECYKTGSCNFCEAIQLLKQIAGWIINVSGSLALLFFIIGGIVLIVSQGNSSRLQYGKKIFFSSLIGLAVVYLAWVCVNFILYNFVGDEKEEDGVVRVFTEPWYKFSCVISESDYIPPTEPVIPVPPGTQACGADINVSCGGDCVGFNISSDLKPSQCSDASPDLVKFLQCLDDIFATGKLGISSSLFNKNDIVLTSISDNNGLNYCRSEATYSRPPCFHMKNSCHYGHGEVDGSYAIDIRSRTLDVYQSSKLQQMVKYCGGDFVDETYTTQPHFHASSPGCGGQ